MLNRIGLVLQLLAPLLLCLVLVYVVDPQQTFTAMLVFLAGVGCGALLGRWLVQLLERPGGLPGVYAEFCRCWLPAYVVREPRLLSLATAAWLGFGVLGIYALAEAVYAAAVLVDRLVFGR